MNNNLYDNLTTVKKNFIEYIDSVKTIESTDYKKYKEMNVKELIIHFNNNKYMVKGNEIFAIMAMCTDLGIDLKNNNECYETLRQYLDFFIQCSDILCN